MTSAMDNIVRGCLEAWDGLLDKAYATGDGIPARSQVVRTILAEAFKGAAWFEAAQDAAIVGTGFVKTEADGTARRADPEEVYMLRRESAKQEHRADVADAHYYRAWNERDAQRRRAEAAERRAEAAERRAMDQAKRLDTAEAAERRAMDQAKRLGTAEKKAREYRTALEVAVGIMGERRDPTHLAPDIDLSLASVLAGDADEKDWQLIRDHLPFEPEPGDIPVENERVWPAGQMSVCMMDGERRALFGQGREQLEKIPFGTYELFARKAAK